MSVDDTVFLALAARTANPDPRSICQIGLALFRDGELSQEWVRLVDSGEEFSFDNIAENGIGPEDMREAVPLRAVIEPLRRLTTGRIVVTHGALGRERIAAAADALGVEGFDVRWLDGAVAAEATWGAKDDDEGGLSGLCALTGHGYSWPGDALKDAIAAGEVLLAACRESGKSPEDWIAAQGAAAETVDDAAGDVGETPSASDGSEDAVVKTVSAKRRAAG